MAMTRGAVQKTPVTAPVPVKKTPGEKTPVERTPGKQTKGKPKKGGPKVVKIENSDTKHLKEFIRFLQDLVDRMEIEAGKAGN
jgi:hypothetical protein